MAHAGFTKSFIPADYGGAGFSMLDLAIAAEELTCVDVNVPTTLLATGLGLQPVIQYGTPEQKERFLRPFADDPEGTCSPPTPSPTWPGEPTSIRLTRPAGCRRSPAATATSG
jgi:Acyl-CoA dehydrogenase, N-terminal domain